MLGSAVRGEVYEALRRNGISESEVSTRFDDVARVLLALFGEGSRVVLHKMTVDLYNEYSQRVDFSYPDPLRSHILMLKDRVVVDHLHPRREYDETLRSFFDAVKRPSSDPT